MGEGGTPSRPPPWRCPTGGSGSGWRRRNDVREETILWEQKTTGNRSITIKEDDWEKLASTPLGWPDPDAAHHPGPKKRRLVVMEEGDFDDGWAWTPEEP